MSKHAAKCPKCGHRVDFDSAVGDHIVCARCHARLRIPKRADADLSQSPTQTEKPPQPARPAVPDDPLIGQTLGEFEILGLLGRGGMGAVYKGRQASLDRLVAIKVLPGHLATNESFVERFSREARAAAAISHPNIIEVFAIGQDKGHQFIAMEFIDGETLADTLKRDGRLAPDRALDILKHVASALAVAHECGIVHRDIKPSNILINQRGLVKVADFGLAKHEGVDVSVTATGAALGTPLYMPPESAQGQPLDARSDLYSLGATFYQALTGKPPFDGTTPAELAVKHVTTKVPPLQQVAPDVPPALCRVIHRLLRKSPAERYDSADKLLEALARVEARVAQPPLGRRSPGEGGSAVGAAATHTLPPDARPATARHSTRRREAVGGTSVPRWLLIAGPIAAAVALVVILIFALGGKGKKPPAKAAVPPPPRRAPSTAHRPPAPKAAAAERNAQTVFKNIRTCIAKKDWQKAERYLARLNAKYGKTKFAAAHKVDIAALSSQIDAALKPTPSSPGHGTEHPKPPTSPLPKPEPPIPQPPQPGEPAGALKVALRRTVDVKHVRVAAISPDGKWLAWTAGGGFHVAPLAALGKEKALFVRGRPNNPVFCLAWGNSRPLMVAHGDPYSPATWNNWGHPHAILFGKGQKSSIHAVAVAPGGRYLASGSSDHSVWLYDLKAKSCAWKRQKVEHYDALRFTHDGRMLICGGIDKKVHLLDVPTGKTLRQLEGHEGRIWSMDISRDGTMLATGGQDKTVRLWDLEACTLRQTLTGHTATTDGVSFSRDGAFVASGSADGTVRLWDAHSGRHLKTLTDQTDRIACVAFSPTEDLLVTAARDGKIRLYDVAAAKPRPAPPDDDERWSEWEDLFDGKTLQGWRVVKGDKFAGPENTTVSDGRVVLASAGRKRPRTGIARAGDFPTWDYQVSLEARRESGQFTFCEVLFPIGDSHCSLVLGAHGGNVVALSTVDGKAAKGNVTTTRYAFETNRWYAIRLAVTRSRVQAWVDSKPVIDLRVAGHRFECVTAVKGARPFAVSNCLAGSAVRCIRLRRLKPDAKPEAKALPWKVYTQWPFDAAEAKRRQAETAKTLGVPVEQDIDLGNGAKMTLVLIPAGEFLMGSPPTTSPEKLQQTFGERVGFYEREFPQHRVTISKPFWLGKTEVTQAQWEAVMGSNPSKVSGRPQNPVEQVSWDDCQDYVEKLRAKLAKPFRLPTEAEWEYACRAGSPTDFYFGDSEAELDQHAWFGANSRRATHPVGQKLPNAWRLHDLYGNVWEWCADGFARYDKAPQVDPKGPGAGHLRVLRGASWFHRPGHCRSAHRLMGRPTLRPPTHGCRVCVVAVPAPARATPRAAKPPAPAQGPATQGREADLQAALKPVEAKVTAWDFAGAAAALRRNVGGVSLPRELAERVARRQEEVERLAGLKAKMIARVNTAKPRLRKSSIGLKGINADLVKADAQGITAKRADGKTETFAWGNLDADSMRRLVRYTAKTTDDHLAAGILLLTLNDAAGAERHFAQAKKAGAATDRYLAPLAAAAFAQAKALLDKKEFKDAEESLAALKKEYGKTAWFASHKGQFDAARGRVVEGEAETLYAQAAKLFQRGDYFELKPCVEKLKKSYAKTRAATDAARRPSFAEMAGAVAKLGKFLTVRRRGKADFRTIQAAINAAPPNSVVEVQDKGVYEEAIIIPEEKQGLVVRGKRGCWPTIGTPKTAPKHGLVQLRAERAAIEGVVILQVKGAGGAINTRTPSARVRRCIVAGRRVIYADKGQAESEGCVFVGTAGGWRGGGGPGWHVARNCIWLVGDLENAKCVENCIVNMVRARGACELRSCTIHSAAILGHKEGPNVVVDSIVGSIESQSANTQIDHCNVYGEGYKLLAKPGKACLRRKPQFRDPENFDYRLRPTSPCRGKASDGGNIGCRYTPEMLEMLKLAHELRRKGIIKF